MPTTVQQDMVDRIVSYIQHNAAKEPAELKRLVQSGHQQLVSLIDGVSEEQAAYKPAPDEWSVLDVLTHASAAQRGVVRLCETLAKGEQPSGLGGEGEEQDGLMGGRRFESLAEAREALESEHGKLVAFIEQDMSSANLEARFRHFIFGDLTCREWAAFQRVHDADHAGQIEKIKASAGFPAAVDKNSL